MTYQPLKNGSKFAKMKPSVTLKIEICKSLRVIVLLIQGFVEMKINMNADLDYCAYEKYTGISW